MATQIEIYGNNVIRIGNNFAVCFDSYKGGRTYEPAEFNTRKIIDTVVGNTPKIIAIAGMKEKEGYVIGECSHSNGWTTDFIIRIGNNIYIASYEEGYKCSSIDISICYSIDDDEFKTDSDDYAIVSDEDDEFICKYAEKYY